MTSGDGVPTTRRDGGESPAPGGHQGSTVGRRPGESRFGGLRRGWLIAAAWLVYLAAAAVAVTDSSRPMPVKVVGVTLVVAFAAIFARGFYALRAVRFGVPEKSAFDRYTSVALLAMLTLAVIAIAGHGASMMVMYLAQAAVLLLPSRLAWSLVALITVGGAFAAQFVWGGSAWDTLPIPGLAFAVWGVRRFFDYMRRLEQAQDELARMAVERERLRFARDLHDIIGHNLSAVTVKLELARKLVSLAGPDNALRAERELIDAEALTRQALGDVRATVGGYREVTIAGELVTARTVLEAAGIAATLPADVDDMPGPRRELFGWVVREAVTNVVRHSRARHCSIEVDARSVEVRDDGDGPARDGVRVRGGLAGGAAAGGAAAGGHGLAGLRERVESAGGTLAAGALGHGHGWFVRAEVPA